MAVRVALNGFGRIGRNIFRVLYDRDDIVVTAICDVANPEHLLYLLKNDTLSGRFEEPIELVNGQLAAKGRLIPFVEGKAPGDVNWRKYDVDVVIEASGRYRTKEELEKHLTAGARRVVLTVPPIGELGTIVRGVNCQGITDETKIVSAGSLGVNALAPILKILDDAFGIDEAFYTLVHAYTNDQTLGDVYKPSDLSNYDSPGDLLRRSRSAPENIIPDSTSSPIELQNILPNLSDRVNGMALSAAVSDGSVVDLVTFHSRPIASEELNAVVRSAAAGRYKGMVEFSCDNIVSADVAGKDASAIFDSKMTSCIDDATVENDERRTMVKTLTWYDNGWSHAYRVVDLVEKLSATL